MLRINRSFIVSYSVFFALLFGVSFVSYDIFLLIAMMSPIFFGMLIYVITINSTISTKNTLLLTIASIYLFVGMLDFVHAISYNGLNFIFNSANESAQILVASRFIEATGFLIALTICRKNEKCFSSLIQALFAILAISSILLISFVDIPAFHTIAQGYTSVNTTAEIFVVILFAISLGILYFLDAQTTNLGKTIVIVLLLKIAAQVILGLFYNQSEMLNVVGYLLRLLSYGALYMLVMKELLQNPQQSIYNRFQKKQDELIRLSQIDQLTKIYNHKTSFYKIEEYLDKHRGESLIYLAMIDIDDFKIINDNYGHQLGDEILERFSKVLYEMNLGNNDRIVGRYGGDEFIVAGRVSSENEIECGFKKFSRKLRNEFKDFELPITCSVGLTFSTDTDTVKDLVYKADIKMYESKQKGKNQITYKGEH